MEPHKTLIPSNNLHNRIHEMAGEIDAAYADSDDLVLVCVLQGARQFADALSQALNTPHRNASVQVSSYGVGTYLSDGNVSVVQPLNTSVQDADVLIVEDIIDTGYSMQAVLNLVKRDNPRSINVAALLSKPSRRRVDVPVKFLGFEIDDHFVFGYGIDVDQKYRELKYIGYFES